MNKKILGSLALITFILGASELAYRSVEAVPLAESAIEISMQDETTVPADTATTFDALSEIDKEVLVRVDPAVGMQIESDELSPLEKEINATLAQAYIVKDPYPKAEPEIEATIEPRVRLALRSGEISVFQAPEYRNFLRQIAIDEAQTQAEGADGAGESLVGLFAEGTYVQDDSRNELNNPARRGY